MSTKNLILLHGALGGTAQLEELRSLLGKRFNVFTINFSGHGGLPIEALFSIDLFVRDTLAFMDAHHLEAAHLFGYSMGGYVALKLAHDHPGRVEKIITLGTKYKWDPESAAKDVRMMNPEVIEQKVPAFAATLAERHKPSDWKTIMKRTGEMMTQLGAGHAMTEEDYRSIEHPVLVCTGTEDHMVSITESENTAHYLQNGQLKIIEGFKHPLEGVDKNILASICNEFFG